MKNKITKVLAALLTLCMLVGMFVMPASAEGAIVADETWYKEDADVLYIYDAADLLAFSAAGQENNFEGKTVKLMADVDLNPGKDFSTTIDGSTITLAEDLEGATKWKSLDRFAGTFDGNGHIIRGLYTSNEMNAGDKRGGFINHIVGGTIKNFIILNSVAVAKNKVSSSSACVAGVVGDIDGGTIQCLYVDVDVWFTNISSEIKGGSVSGVIGQIKNKVCTVDDVVYAGELGIINTSNTTTSYGNTYVAGIVGNNYGEDSDSLNGETPVEHMLGDIAMLGKRHSKTGANSSNDKAFTDAIRNRSNSYYVGVMAMFVIDDGDTGGIADDANTSCTWHPCLGGGWEIENATYTYAERGWVKFVIEDAPFEMRYPTSQYSGYYFLPGDVADMIMGNYESTGLYVQEKLDGSAVRFIGVVDVSEAELGNLEALGMNITMTYGEDTYSYSFTTTTVYKSLLANGVEVNVSELNGTYFYAVEITGLDAATGDVKFDFSGTVKPIGAESVVFASASYTYAK